LQLALRNGHVDYSGMLCDAGSIVNKKVVLKNGKESTTFGHALSLSLINIAYLIMERGVVIIGKSFQKYLYLQYISLFSLLFLYYRGYT
jgi:hypothetical protein